jgi:uncharacterized protein (DUF2141 family)
VIPKSLIPSLVFCLLLLINISFSTTIISGNIRGTSGNHPLVINLFNAESWSKRTPKDQIVIPADTISTHFNFTVTADSYGLVVIEDKDKNGKISFGIFGPSEPLKVYNLTKSVFGPPNFNDFKFNVSGDIIHCIVQF